MRPKRPHTSGAATSFMSRQKALRKLQLSLKDFRRLCIIKGVYPREPLHRKKALKGATDNRVLYSVKDIAFLNNEPLLDKFRSDKVFLRRIKTARRKKEPERIQRILDNRPELKFDHIVRERYPNFSSALRDLDDCLCLCFAFAVLPRTRIIRRQLIDQCRRLTSEFMHYVIESHSLTKVFISIKGIYYQAEVMGERVTWIVGHERAVGRLKDQDIDLPVMTTFSQFYTTMLKFVNFRLYKSLGLYYPPKLSTDEENSYAEEDEQADRVCSLARPLLRSGDSNEPDVTIDTFGDEESSEQLADRLKEAERLKTLFSKCCFYLNREVPKEPLALVIRNCGGSVSWDDCPTKSYDYDSPMVTHVIVDRPIDELDVRRKFLQPQWVFDSFNARRQLPIDNYKSGSKLPPHLSPFTEDRIGDYIPLERIEQLKEDGKDVSHLLVEPTSRQLAKEPKKVAPVRAENPETGVQVKQGQKHRIHPQIKLNAEGQELKLQELMIPKRFKRAYQKIKFSQKRKEKETRQLTAKRAKAAQEETKIE